jgi:hypothetical protein
MVKIDIVIPSYIGDFHCILPCIKNLAEQTVKPNNIIICVSEINNNHKIYLEDEINKLQLNFNLIINDTPLKQNASENRNRGIDYCLNYSKPDYIMFCDCDDIIHTKKIESFIYFYNMMDTNINLFVHDYAFSQERFDIYSDVILNKNKLLLCYNSNTCTNLYTIPYTDIAHGYSTVKLELCNNIKFNTQLQSGEDGDFCQRINNIYGTVYSYTEKLINYMP